MKLSLNAIAIELWLDDSSELEEQEAAEQARDELKAALDREWEIEHELWLYLHELEQLAAEAEDRGDIAAAREHWGIYSDVYKDLYGVRPR